jgi:hypothetical protein
LLAIFNNWAQLSKLVQNSVLQQKTEIKIKFVKKKLATMAAFNFTSQVFAKKKKN